MPEDTMRWWGHSGRGMWYHLYSALMTPSEEVPESMLLKIFMAFCAVDDCKQIEMKTVYHIWCYSLSFNNIYVVGKGI